MEQKVEFASIDHHFGQFVSRLAKENVSEITLLSELVSFATRSGHGCLDLRDLAGMVIPGSGGVDVALPGLDGLRDIAAQSGVVGTGDGQVEPLVIDNDRLYLRRYWEYENEVATFILRAASKVVGSGGYPPLEPLGRLFPEESGGADRHRLAALVALERPFVVITGGPGTGKTTTIARIMALLLECSETAEMRIALTAPTGKAVMRLQESISGAMARLDCSPRIKEKIPLRAETLHRLLGAIRDSPNFRHHSANKLPYDLVVVDEASMVDLPLMAKLVRAIPDHCKLVILGDRDQLSSVEPGAVLGDICCPAAVNNFSASFAAVAREVAGGDDFVEMDDGAAPLADSLVELKTCFRFSKGSGIGELAYAIKGGECDKAIDLTFANEYPDIVWRDFGQDVKPDRLTADLSGRKGVWTLKDGSPGEMLSTMGDVQVLCALRKGPFGVEEMNRRIWRAVSGQRADFRENPVDGFPLIITQNDYQLGLFNGDTGVVAKDPDDEMALKAFFPAVEDSVRFFALSSLPLYEACYAMTVHKSQGSEFGEVILILPDNYSQVITRELIYTAVTRARNKLEIWGNRDVFRDALSRKTSRSSGLGQKLWGSGCL